MDLSTQIEDFFKERYKDWSGSAQFEGTGERLERMVQELCWDPERIDTEVAGHLMSQFEDGYDELLVSGPTEVWTLCPHHILPCQFKVYVGYLPNGHVLGLSKFSRIAITMGKRPIMQEQYSRELVDVLETGLNPKGVGVYVEGIHGCMFSRGVGQSVPVATSVLRGVLLSDPSAKEEFFDIIDRNH